MLVRVILEVLIAIFAVYGIYEILMPIFGLPWRKKDKNRTEPKRHKKGG